MTSLTILFVQIRLRGRKYCLERFALLNLQVNKTTSLNHIEVVHELHVDPQTFCNLVKAG